MDNSLQTLANPSFWDQVWLAAIRGAVPTVILALGGWYIFGLYQTAKKKREQDIELMRIKRDKDVELERFNRQKDIELMRMQYDKDVELERFNRQKDIELERIKHDKDVELERFQHEKEIQIDRFAREKEIELARFIREHQYKAIAELYSFFAEFMRIYRFVNAPDTNLEDEETRVRLFEDASIVEGKVDALILRIASEFTHDNSQQLYLQLSELRQSVQIWRENIGKKEGLPFYKSGQEDYMRFKKAFVNVATLITSEIYRPLDAPELSVEQARTMLLDIFDNKHESHGAH